jgi:Leucine-rich repeat (LRR) protein
MQVFRFFPGTHAVVLAFVACCASFSAQGATPLPSLSAPNLQTCLTEQANRNGWQYAEQVTQLSCSGRGVTRLDGIEGLLALAELDLSSNAIADVGPLSALRALTKLNLSGNRSIAIVQLRPVLDTNWGLTSLGLNGIRVGSFSNLGALFNPQTGHPYDLVELDLGNTGLFGVPTGGGGIGAGGGVPLGPPDTLGLLLLLPFSNLERLNVADNGIINIQGLTSLYFPRLAELDLSGNRITDISPLTTLSTLTKLNLSRTFVSVSQVRPVLDMNWGLTRLGLNGIPVGFFSNLGALFNPQTGRPYDLVELDLGNTGLFGVPTGGGLGTGTGGAGSGIPLGPPDTLGLLLLQPFNNLERLNVAGNGIINIQALTSLYFPRLAELDLSGNPITGVSPLTTLSTLTKLNLSRTFVPVSQLRPVLDVNWGLTSLGLNGIYIGAFSNLGVLFNPQTGRPYDFVELDLGNTGLTDPSGSKNLDFLQLYSNLTRLNVAANGIDNLQVFMSPNPSASGPNFARLAELDLSNNAMVDIGPLTGLRTLATLNLLDNTQVGCVDLDNLALALPYTKILRSVNCTGANAWPVANAGADQSVDEGSVVTLAGSGVDSDGTIVSYSWRQISGVPVFMSYNPTSGIASFTAPAVGAAGAVLGFELTVTDNGGSIGTAITHVTVKNVNQLPTANAGASQTVNEGASVTLAGSGTDPDGTIASYLWTQTAGPAATLVNANSATATFAAPQVTSDTVLTFQLMVTDNNGATATATTAVKVENVRGADLVVTAVSGSVTTVRRGSSFSFASITKNAGDRSTSTSTTTGLYLSSDATTTASDVRVGTVSIAGLGSGQAVNAVNRVTVPRTLAPGTYYLGAIADYTQRQSELDETNNSLTGIAIQVTQ